MLLQPGVTSCEACHAPVDATDDLFVVKNWKGTEKIAGCRPGFYHYACFLRSGFAAEYLRLDAQQKGRQLDQRADQWQALVRDEDFALIYKRLAGQFTLYFLQLGREVDFFDRERIAALLQMLVDGGETADARIVTKAGATSLQFREAVPISVALARPDYERLLDDLPKLDAKSSEVIDVGELCGRFGISPQHSDCDLSRARGTVVSLEPLAASGSSYIDLEVEKWKEVRMSAAVFDRLRSFAAAAQAALQDLA